MPDKTPSAAPAPESHPDELRIRGAIHMIEEGDLCHWNFDHDRVTLSALRLALADYTPAPAREAIARAICLACEENPDHRGDARGNDWRWQDYLGAADAAIAAGATPAPAPAVPARQAISQLFAIAADLAQLKPIARLSSLGGNRHIGHRQFGGAYMASEEALRGLAVRLRGAIDAITAATPAPAQAVPLVQQTAPERIWLQVSDDDADADLPFDHPADVTWSRDQAINVTVPYVRADLAHPLYRAIPSAGMGAGALLQQAHAALRVAHTSIGAERLAVIDSHQSPVDGSLDDDGADAVEQFDAEMEQIAQAIAAIESHQQVTHTGGDK